MRDEADKIINELLARGGLTRAELRRQAIEQLHSCGVRPSTPSGREFLKQTMIVIAARDDAEANALLARANGASPSVTSVEPLSDDARRKAGAAIQAFARGVSCNLRGSSAVH
jgi:hypothetical protein